MNSNIPYRQFAKFIIVGCLNTAVTLSVIALCKSVLGINLYLSNLIGYVAGVVNAFMWNKMWVFHADGHMARQASRFLAGFIVCYLMQLGVVWAMLNLTPLGAMTWLIGSYTLSGYGVATVIGMALYTIANFIINKFFAFSR